MMSHLRRCPVLIVQEVEEGTSRLLEVAWLGWQLLEGSRLLRYMLQSTSCMSIRPVVYIIL